MTCTQTVVRQSVPGDTADSVKLCCAPTAGVYSWPGQPDAEVCAHHLEAVRQVAKVMGFDLSVRPPTRAEAIDSALAPWVPPEDKPLDMKRQPSPARPAMLAVSARLDDLMGNPPGTIAAVAGIEAATQVRPGVYLPEPGRRDRPLARDLHAVHEPSTLPTPEGMRAWAEEALEAGGQIHEERGADVDVVDLLWRGCELVREAADMIERACRVEDKLREDLAQFTDRST